MELRLINVRPDVFCLRHNLFDDIGNIRFSLGTRASGLDKKQILKNRLSTIFFFGGALIKPLFCLLAPLKYCQSHVNRNLLRMVP